MTARRLRKTWSIDLRFNNRRYRLKSPDNSKAGAEAYEAFLRGKLARGESIDRSAEQPVKTQTFEQFSGTWFDGYVVSNNKFSEQKMKRSILKSALVPFFGKMSVEKITEQHIEQFKARGIAAGLARKTVNNHLAVFSKCLATAYEWLKLPGKPPRVVWLKCPPVKADYLSPDECTLLLSGATGVMYEMILTALRTGMRQGELIGLQWSSINWVSRTLTVRHSHCYYTKALVAPKSNRVRDIPLDTDVYESLYKRKKDTGYVFTNEQGQSFGSRGNLNKLKKIALDVGLRKIGWHTLRHTFATHLAANNQPMPTVQALLGHSTVSMTMRYAHVAPESLHNAIATLNPKHALNSAFGQPVGNHWAESIQQESRNT